MRGLDCRICSAVERPMMPPPMTITSVGMGKIQVGTWSVPDAAHFGEMRDPGEGRGCGHSIASKE